MNDRARASPPDPWPAPPGQFGENIPISNLPLAVQPLTGNEWVAVVQGGVTCRANAWVVATSAPPDPNVPPAAFAQNQTLVSGPPPSFTWVPTAFSELPYAQTFIGSFNASAGTIAWTPASGLSGNTLPPPYTGNSGSYVICTSAGANPPPGAPAATYTQGDWLLSDGTTWTHLTFGTSSILATAVTVSPAVAGASNTQAALTAINANQANYLSLSGGAMTGPIVLSGAATSALNPATYQQLQTYLPLSGGTMTGNFYAPRIAGSTPSAVLDAFVIDAGTF